MKKQKLLHGAILTVLSALLMITASGCSLLQLHNSSDTNRYLVSSENTEPDDRVPVSYQPKNYGEVKAVWISYLELQTMLTGKSREDFTASVQTAYQNVAALGLNTVIVQVRPFGDAIYPSRYFPWSAYAKGYGEDPGYDPLAILIEEAHRLGLSFHAWLNPYRGQTEEEAEKTAADYPFAKWYHGQEKGTNIVNLSGRWYYNPGVEAVRQLIIGGIKELVLYYEVDGIHMDDYFYPITDAAFDDALYQEYRSQGGSLELAAWRRENVNALLRDAYLAIKKINDGVMFGVSPQANISNNFNLQYADVIRWCSTAGYLDYICPQIYYSFKSETTDFDEALNQWVKLAEQSAIKLYVGVAPYKLGREDKWACTDASGGGCSAPNDCGKNGWMVSDSSKSDILKRQYEKIQAEERCSGIFFYSYRSLFEPEEALRPQAENELQQLKKVLLRE